MTSITKSRQCSMPLAKAIEAGVEEVHKGIDLTRAGGEGWVVIRIHVEKGRVTGSRIEPMHRVVE